MDDLSFDFSVTDSTDFVWRDTEPTEAGDLFDEFFADIRHDSSRIEDTFSDLYDYNDERGKELALALKTNTHVRRITFVMDDTCFPITDGAPKDDFISPTTFREIMESIKSNLITGVKEIKLQGCNETKDEDHLPSDANTKAIAWLMTERPGLLEKLALRSGFIRHAVTPLCNSIMLPQNRLLHLDLSYNIIDDDGAQAISKLLRKDDCTLVFLNLKGNFIRDYGIDSLADSLVQNKNLQYLDVSYNRFFTDSVIRFAVALRVNRSIRKIFLRRRYELPIESSNREAIEFITTLRLNKRIIRLERDPDEVAETENLERLEYLLRRNKLIHDMYHIWRPRLFETISRSREEDAFLVKICTEAMTRFGSEGPVFLYFFIRETPLTNYLFDNGEGISRRLDAQG